MIVIAKSRGPNYNGLGIYSLTKGKKYKVVPRSFPDMHGTVPVNENETFFMPKKFKFYIDVIADNGRLEAFWNDYFLSTIEIRKLKIKELNVIQQIQ
jgi:hypothetical protein